VLLYLTKGRRELIKKLLKSLVDRSKKKQDILDESQVLL